MCQGDLAEDLGICFAGIGIEGDHLAAAIAFENRDHQLRSDLEALADK
jgi:hypothetical protein